MDDDRSKSEFIARTRRIGDLCRNDNQEHRSYLDQGKTLESYLRRSFSRNEMARGSSAAKDRIQKLSPSSDCRETGGSGTHCLIRAETAITT
jgi:hypothetical protein